MYDNVMDEHFTVEEAAAKLKFSMPTVRRLLRTGELIGVKFGPRQWRVSETAIRDYVKKMTTPAVSADVDSTRD